MLVIGGASRSEADQQQIVRRLVAREHVRGEAAVWRDDRRVGTGAPAESRHGSTVQRYAVQVPLLWLSLVGDEEQRRGGWRHLEFAHCPLALCDSRRRRARRRKLVDVVVLVSIREEVE